MDREGDAMNWSKSNEEKEKYGETSFWIKVDECVKTKYI